MGDLCNGHEVTGQEDCDDGQVVGLKKVAHASPRSSGYTQLLLCLIMRDLCLEQHFLLLFDFEHIVGGQSVGSVDDKLSCGVPYWAWRCGLSLCGVLYALSTEAQVKL